MISTIVLGAALLAAAQPAAESKDPSAATAIADVSGPISVSYPGGAADAFSASERRQILDQLRRTHAAVREHFPSLSEEVQVTITAVDRDLASVGGVSGRADAPGAIAIEISSAGQGGVSAAIETGLAPVFAHELHHLVRGWTISGNRYGPGIAIAAVNEGLAVAFSEELTGQAFPGNAPPEDAIAADWAMEIHALPVHAGYGEWMFAHPDGREGVGYRTGHYLVRQAMARSGRDTVSLTEATPEEIWSLSGLAE